MGDSPPKHITFRVPVASTNDEEFTAELLRGQPENQGDIPVMKTPGSCDPNDVIGWAKLADFDGEYLKAELRVQADLMPCLMDHYPSVSGKILRCHNEGGQRIIDEMEIFDVSLTEGPNVDDAIRTVRECLEDEK